MIICFESKKILNNLFVKYTDLQSQSGPQITHFPAVAGRKLKNFE